VKGDLNRCWLICDHKFIRRYGLGAVKPFPISIQPWLENGYLKCADSIEALAQKCGIQVEAFKTTVTTYNTFAKNGTDPEFHRGTTPYQKAQGDAENHPNPCIALIEKSPFYAIEIVPGSLGTFAGLNTDCKARVLDKSTQRPIKGLYAVGNDMNTIMGGQYPSGGITLGPAMTFGFIVGKQLAQHAKLNSHTQNMDGK